MSRARPSCALAVLGCLAASAACAQTGFERVASGIAPCVAAPANGSVLAVALLADAEQPEWILAQRTIEREWTTPGDPNAPPALPGLRSEAGVLALSAAIPGAGQLAIGERSGFVFALAEALGWFGYFVWRGDADELRDLAEQKAGVPDDPQSNWSFERWVAATQEDPAQLRALYEGDREVFFQLIERDDRYQAGWVNEAVRASYLDLRERSDERLRRSGNVGRALWINHLVAAADALRAARIQNLPLRRNVDLKASGGWSGGQPALRLAVQGRF
jgi:hypothetical protein